jgi:hypothetical protein
MRARVRHPALPQLSHALLDALSTAETRPSNAAAVMCGHSSGQAAGRGQQRASKRADLCNTVDSCRAPSGNRAASTPGRAWPGPPSCCAVLRRRPISLRISIPHAPSGAAAVYRRCSCCCCCCCCAALLAAASLPTWPTQLPRAPLHDSSLELLPRCRRRPSPPRAPISEAEQPWRTSRRVAN